MGNAITDHLRNRLLLSSALLTGALSGYAGRAYGACVNTGGSSFVCSGTSPAQAINNTDNAAVSTAPAPAPQFSVTTNGVNALNITGNGALSFTDVNQPSVLINNATGGSTSIATGLFIRSGGDAVGTAGSVTVDTHGLVRGRYGIVAQNLGTGALTITVNGDVTGGPRGITALNSGTNLTVTTALGSTVTGTGYGLFARNDTPATGALTVTANGNLTGGTAAGIYARNGTPPV